MILVFMVASFGIAAIGVLLMVVKQIGRAHV